MTIQRRVQSRHDRSPTSPFFPIRPRAREPSARRGHGTATRHESLGAARLKLPYPAAAGLSVPRAQAVRYPIKEQRCE